MNKKNLVMVVAALAVSMVAGCASAPETRPEQRGLEARADATVEQFVARDPSLGDVLARAAGYAVFPEVTEGGFIVGGSQGVGVVYSRFTPIGYSELRAGSVGLQAGGQAYAQIVIFDTEEALNRLMAGNFDMSAGVTATALASGVGASLEFEGGTAVLVDDETGLMAGAAVEGQNLNFTAK